MQEPATSEKSMLKTVLREIYGKNPKGAIPDRALVQGALSRNARADWPEPHQFEAVAVSDALTVHLHEDLRLPHLRCQSLSLCKGCCLKVNAY